MLYSTLYMLYSMEAELHKSAGCCTPCICCSLVYVIHYFRPCICCTVPCICCTVWRPCICCTVWRQNSTSLLAAVRLVYVVNLYMLYTMEALYMLYSTLYMLYSMEALYMLYSMEAELHKSAGCCTPCIWCSLVYVVKYLRPCICCTVPCICCTVWRPCICCTVWRQSCTSLLAAVRLVYVVALYMLYRILGLV